VTLEFAVKWKLQGWAGDKVQTHVAQTDTHLLFVLRTSESSEAKWKAIQRRKGDPVHGQWERSGFATKEEAMAAAEQAMREGA
jgi:hypothetical protein